jgi:hypothetical protein
MKNNIIEKSKLSVEGHVVIRDADTAEVLLDKYNAINFENFAFAVAHLLANKESDTGHGYFISTMAFGHGGTVVNPTGNITYKEPKVNGADGGLYMPSPGVVIDTNFEKEITEFRIDNTETQPYTDLICTVLLDYDDPSTAMGSDIAEDFETPENYVFDELALVTENGDFLTHLIFHPIQKSRNRKLEIIYSIRIRAGI